MSGHVTGHWIAGEQLTVGGELLDVVNPANGSVLGSVELAGDGVADQAVAAARGALPAWRDTPPARRAQILFRLRELVREHASELAEIVTAEHGKTIDDACGEVNRALDSVELACSVPSALRGRISEQTGLGIDTYWTPHPVGVCLVISPFNFPVMIPLSAAAIAIACGNTCVLKPSEQAPGAALRIAELASQAGLPDGVLNVVQGRSQTAEALISHPDVAAVSFVGSTPVARAVYQRAVVAGKRAQAFGGAKNHLVVMPDAPADSVADALASAAFGAAGQRCMAVSVAVLVGEAGDAVPELLTARARAILLGDGAAPGTQMGPLINQQAQHRVRGQVHAAIAAGATALVDRSEEVVPGYEHGFFTGPVLLDHVTADMEIYRSELFGPVLCMMRVSSLDEALALIADHEYGNGASIFTRNGAAARTFTRNVEAGMVGVNVPIPVPVASFGAGGWKNSVFGDTTMNSGAWRFFSRPKSITTRWDAVTAGPDFGFRPN